jgi:uncharacterized membrane protein YdjX (TVP38/TMEM64 family)
MRSGLKRGIVTAALLLFVALAFLVRPQAVLDVVRGLLDSRYFPLVLLGLYVVRPFLAWPITALAVLVGFKYGLVIGVPVAVLGGVVSTLIPYSAVRYFDFDAGVLGWAAEESDQFFEATGDLRGLLAARIAPVPAEATSLAAGAADVRPHVYVVGTVVGELPWAVAAVLIGHSMHQLTLADASYDPWLLVATTIAGLVLLVGPAIKLVRGDGGGADQPA